MTDFLAKNNTTGEITYLDILNDDYTALTNDEIQEYETQKQNVIKKTQLQAQIDELDIKRIRAGFEPSVKDETTGETYLEYYTNQIQDLREEINNL